MTNKDLFSEGVCRLCSSKKFLINVFGGTSRIKRDFVRKLIQLTVGISMEESDQATKCVCVNCCIDTVNFYRFQQQCQNNSQRLEKHCEGSERGSTTSITSLKSIVLPPLTILLVSLGEWLKEKRSTAATYMPEIAPQNKKGQKKLHCDTLVQTDPICTNSSSTQVEMLIKLTATHSQTDIIRFQNGCSQTEVMEFKSPKSVRPSATRRSDQKMEIVAPEVPLIKQEPEQEPLQNKTNLLLVTVKELMINDEHSEPVVEPNILPNSIPDVSADQTLTFNSSANLSIDTSMDTSSELNGFKSSFLSPKSAEVMLVKKRAEVCEFCNKTLASQASLKRHKRSIHFYCVVCKATLGNSLLMKTHLCDEYLPASSSNRKSAPPTVTTRKMAKQLSVPLQRLETDQNVMKKFSKKMNVLEKKKPKRLQTKAKPIESEGSTSVNDRFSRHNAAGNKNKSVNSSTSKK